MKTFIVEYQGEKDDEIFENQIEIEAKDEVEAWQKFFSLKINYRILKSITLK